MRRAANYVMGWVDLEVTGESPEEFFNLCARQDLGFWRVRKLEKGQWRCRVALLDWGKVPALAGKSGCAVRLLGRGGAPGLLWQLRYRWALLAGLVVCLAAVALAGQVVLSVQVSGNRRVPTGAILTQLRAQGVRPGAFGPGIDVRQVCHGVMLELPELSWMTINRRGTVCQVLVREGVPRPEIMDEDAPAHIVARYPGIVTHVDTARGQQLVEEGRTVAAGDVLIGSWVDFVEPEGYQGDMGGMTVRAVGRVRARTWHTLQAAMPLESREKRFTGREKRRWSLEFFGRELKIYPGGGIPYGKYDKIAVYHTAVLPGGTALPVQVREEVCREYDTAVCPVDRDGAGALLRERLIRRLAQLAGEDEIIRVSWQTQETGGLLTVTLLAECEQEIGLTVEE